LLEVEVAATMNVAAVARIALRNMDILLCVGDQIVTPDSMMHAGPPPL
jgi:hypothetical protein